jgi:hypothetical protein
VNAATTTAANGLKTFTVSNSFRHEINLASDEDAYKPVLGTPIPPLPEDIRQRLAERRAQLAG